jgi:hypothetical protein
MTIRTALVPLARLTILALGVCVSLHAASDQADRPVASARLVLAREPVQVVRVHLRNTHTSPLVTWQVEVGGRSMWMTRRIPPFAPGDGPIEPNEDRSITLHLEDPWGKDAGARPLVTLAVARDGLYQGALAPVERELGRVNSVKADAQYWNDVIARMPTRRAEDALEFVRARIAQSPATAAMNDAGIQPLSSQIAQILKAPAAADSLFRRLDSLRRTIAARLAEPEHRLATAPLAFAWSELGTDAKIVASLENLSSFPITAFGIEVVDEHGHVDQAMSSSFNDPAGIRLPRGQGSIVAGEVRRVQTLVDHDVPDAEWPKARLSFVVFADGRIEGSRRAAEGVFRTK